MLTRRTVLAGLSAAAALPAVAPAAAQVTAAVAPTIPGVGERTRAFLHALDPARAAAARFELGSATWRNWNYFGNQLVKPGARFEEMTAAERDAGTELLVTMLSPVGFDKVERVRALQDVLAAQRIGPPDRNSGRYSLAVFDEPSAGALWGLRLEGHHLELTMTLRGDEVVSVTPSSFSCNPNDVTIGPYAGTTAIVGEEALARQLFASLTTAQRNRALLSERPITNITAVAGQETYFRTPDGVAAADLSVGQRDLIWQIVDIFAAEHWPAEIAAAQQARVREGDAAAVHFAWAGGNVEDTRLYYRLQGDTFVIELAAVDPAAQHLHTIYHDTERTLGRHVL